MAPAYILTGRGGAGNTLRAPPSPSSSSSSSSSSRRTPSSPSYSSSTTPRCVSSGVGGAGNIRTLDSRSSASAAAAMARDVKDDISRAAARDRAPVGYAGRGGAGNAYSYRAPVDEAASDMSGSSVGSKAKLWLSRTLSRD